MRYRNLLIALSFTFMGCSSLCPIRHQQQSSPSIAETGTAALPPAYGTVGQSPTQQVQPLPTVPPSPAH
jgi:hypothetical protein